MAVKSGTVSSSTAKACISSTSSSAASNSCASACWQSGSAARPNLMTMARSVSERSVSSTHVALGSEPSATAADDIWACLTFRLPVIVSLGGKERNPSNTLLTQRRAAPPGAAAVAVGWDHTHWCVDLRPAAPFRVSRTRASWAPGASSHEIGESQPEIDSGHPPPRRSTRAARAAPLGCRRHAACRSTAPPWHRRRRAA